MYIEDPNLNKAERQILEYFSPDTEPASGAAIAKATSLSAGDLYPALHKLETNGLIASRRVDGGHPKRKFYTITRAGVEARNSKSFMTEKDEHWPWVASGCMSGCSGAASVFVMICVAGIFLF